MPVNVKIALPIALGLSLVTVTAFVVYYVFKKDDEDDSNTDTIKTSRVNVIEIHVPKSIVPALIGRSGANIKTIEKKSGALIHFKKFSDKEYDVCIIRGRSEATQLAETFVHEFIKQQPVIIEDSISVPAWACGRIIGAGGENINEISHRSGARVKIEGLPMGDKTSNRMVSFRGTKEQIEVAKGLVENTVAQEKCRREIEQSKRSPRHVPSPTSSPTPQRAKDPPTSSPTPQEAKEPPTPPASPAGSDREEPGEARPRTHAHVKYKRPETHAANIEVYVSAVSSPSRFWVQFVGPQVSQLDDLVAHMTEYYSNKENRAAHALQHVSVGQVVAAVFRHDGRWYRARVHDIRPNEFDSSQQVADVFFLDYGDSEYVATHELCELRADLLRLRFQAMECFLAGVKPAGNEKETVGMTAAGQRWDRWHPQAIERFEELTQVARWKALVSRTCTYKKTGTNEGDKVKEIPGIKLFDVTDEGELDVGAVLIEEGWAVAGELSSPRPSPPRGSHTPFGDLFNSKVLCMEDVGGRSASLPKDHKDDGSDKMAALNPTRDNEGMTASKSLSSGLETSDRNPLSVSNFDLSYSDKPRPQLNGSQNAFLHNERQHLDLEGSMETLTPTSSTLDTPILSKTQGDEFKANMNRIDSHHSNLESLADSQTGLYNN